MTRVRAFDRGCGNRWDAIAPPYFDDDGRFLSPVHAATHAILVQHGSADPWREAGRMIADGGVGRSRALSWLATHDGGFETQIEIAKLLDVRVLFDPAIELEVDASAIASEHDVKFWRLLPFGYGEWRHPESNETGPLSELLRSIACTYLRVPDPSGVET